MHPDPTPISVVHALAPARVGGLESVVLALAAGQVAAGAQVYVVPVLSEGAAEHPFLDALAERGIHVEPLWLGARQYGRERRAIREVLRRVRAQVLHTHGYRSDVVAGSVAGSMGVVRVTTVHGYTGGSLKNRAYEWIQRRMIRRFDAILAVSDKLRTDLIAGGVPAARVHRVGNAWEPTEPPLEAKAAREALSINQATPRIGWIGRMSPEKAAGQVVRALALARTPNLHLSMIGTGTEEQAVRTLGRTLGVDSRIQWHGVVPAAGRYLRAFDAVVLSSLSEGTPMVLLEAMCAGVPIVATAVGGVPDLVGPHAVLVPPGDPESLARGVDEVLRDVQAAALRASESQARARREFRVETWVARHLEIYSDLIGESEASRGP